MNGNVGGTVHLIVPEEGPPLACVEPRHYRVRETLRNGNPVHIRAIRPDDKDLLLNVFKRLSYNTLYFRFHHYKRELSGEELAYYTELDFINRVGLLATFDSFQEKIGGVGRFIVHGGSHPGKSVAEVAFTVVEEYRNLGICTMLLNHLARVARGQGVKIFTAEVLPENHQMLDVFDNSGYKIERFFDNEIVHVSLFI